jgi:hypothetical protein
LKTRKKRTDSQARGLQVRSAGELLQPYALRVGVGVAALAGQNRLKATKDGRIPLERNEEILLGVHGSGPNREETVCMGRRVCRAVGAENFPPKGMSYRGAEENVVGSGNSESPIPEILSRFVFFWQGLFRVCMLV